MPRGEFSAQFGDRPGIFERFPRKKIDARVKVASSFRKQPCSFAGWYEDNWFEINLKKEEINCTVEQMRIAAEGHMTTEALMWNQDGNEKTISGMTSDEFRTKLDSVLSQDGYDIANQRYPAGYQEAPLAYDAVWSVALGITLQGYYKLLDWVP